MVPEVSEPAPFAGSQLQSPARDASVTGVHSPGVQVCEDPPARERRRRQKVSVKQ